MIDAFAIAYYSSVILVIALSIIGNGMGGGKIGKAALEAIDIQPRAKNEIMRATVIGLALLETAALLALIIVLFMLFTARTVSNPWQMVAQMGTIVAIGLPALLVGVYAAPAIEKTCKSIARQPFFYQSIINMMLITQVVIQTAVIFGFLISLLIFFNLSQVTTWQQAVVLCMAGTALGLGAIGPIIGLSAFAQTVCEYISINRTILMPSRALLSFTFLSCAIIETPLILAFIIALAIGLSTGSIDDPYLVARTFAAALCIALGTLGPCLASSKTAAQTARQIAQNPSMHLSLSHASMFAQGIIDASAIYALLVSLIILFIK
ncbi:MAG: hypothetical protein WCE21_04265 [Candidatus Babeliales bacterium]